MSIVQDPANTGQSEIGGYTTDRPVVRGTRGMVAAGHYLTAIAGMRLLLSGGNAFDAAVASGFAAAVIEPTASFSIVTECSIMLYHAPTQKLRVVSGQGRAPARATQELFADRGFDHIPTGPGPNAELSFTVPGAVDAFIVLLETYGTKTLGEVMAPAIGYARDGFPVYEIMYNRIANRPTGLEMFRRYPPGGWDVFCPEGSMIPVGQLIIQKQLAGTLTRLVDAESSAGGDRIAGLQAAREMFYRGDVARTIVTCSDRVGGLLTMEDLAGFKATFEEPISTTYMGHHVYAQPTWSQGAVLIQALNILERFDLRAMGHNSPEYIHTVVEALKLAMADRETYYGDPDFTKVPMEGLLSKEYAANRAALIKADEACPELPEPGDPWRHSGAAPAPLSGVTTRIAPSTEGALPDSGGDTTHLATMDREGNVVCITASGGRFDKSPFFPELGCTLSTRSEMFFLEPGHPNGLEPGKRPRTTLVNYVVCKDGRPVMTAGTPGGDSQAQTDLQLILNVLVFGMDPQQAVEMPRFSSLSVPNSFYPHGYFPGRVDVQEGLPQGTRAALTRLGHEVADATEDSCGVGAIVLTRAPETGTMGAGADPRLETYALGW